MPGMAKTDCKFVCFIMNEINKIEEEMDMWTKEFGKYFAVIKVKDYQSAMEKMHYFMLVNAQ